MVSDRRARPAARAPRPCPRPAASGSPARRRWRRRARSRTTSRRSQSAALPGQQHLHRRRQVGRSARGHATCPSVTRIAPAIRGRAALRPAPRPARSAASVPASPGAVAERAPRAARSAGSAASSASSRASAGGGLRRRGRRCVLAGAVVDHHDDDVGQRRAVLASAATARRAPPAAPAPPARAATSRSARATAPAPAPSAASTASAAISGQRQQRIEDQMPAAASLPQPFQQRRHMHLVGFVVAGQHIHDQVDAEAVAPSRAGARRRCRARPGTSAGRSPSTAQAAAQSLPPITTGVTPSLRLRNGMPSTCSASRATPRPRPARPDTATGEILQQIEGAGQHMVGRHRLQRRNVERRRRCAAARRPFGRGRADSPPRSASRVSNRIMPPKRR